MHFLNKTVYFYFFMLLINCYYFKFSEYARPHAGFSPVSLQRSAPGLGLPPHCIDPMLHYQFNMYPRDR